MLAVYAFVFSTIFKARIPEAAGIGFVPYLAIAFWPWTAFSEAVLRANSSIISNSELIGKVAFASEQLPLASVTATFIMHMIGYLSVLIVLQLMGTAIQWLHLLIAIPVLLLLWVLACSVSLFTSAIQVFIRDVGQILPPVMTFWFFTTPILYSSTLLPESIQTISQWNLMAWFVDKLRDLLLFGRVEFGIWSLMVVLSISIFAWLSLKFFRRFSAHFEDFM